MSTPTSPHPSEVDHHGGWASILAKLCDQTDLGRDEAEAVMSDVLHGLATPAQIAGFVVALRMKGESIDEMTGLAEAMRAAAEPLDLPPETVDIVGTGGSDHRRRHALNVSSMASIVAASAGGVVCKHGNRRASSTSGSMDFLEALGVGIDLAPSDVERCVADVGVGFAFARAFHPALRHAGPVRSEIGIPTVFNVLGPLAHPGQVTRQVIGTPSVDLAAKMAAVIKNLGGERVWVVAGDGGLDELTLSGPSLVFDVTDEGIDRVEITASEVGLPPAPVEELIGGTATDNARIFTEIVAGATGPRRDMVVLNAAAGLVVGGVCDSLAAAVERAAAAIDHGETEKTLAALIDATGSDRPGAGETS